MRSPRTISDPAPSSASNMRANAHPSALASTPDLSADASHNSAPDTAVADGLKRLHFTAQHEATHELADVALSQLDPFLRSVLFTDGTVSRALEAQTLCHIAVETLEQLSSHAPKLIARYLDVEHDEQCLRRRVVMTIAGTHPSVWAESYLVPKRLPQQFLIQLDGNSQGIGGSLQQLKLESRRELLWFGLSPLPRWAGDTAPATTALTRFYRVLTQGLPALLISESFAVELRSGQYHLTSAAGANAHAANRR